jgi:hypothetical protein
VLGADGLPLIADRTRLPPYPVSKFASGMDSLMGDAVEELQVLKPVVLLVSVNVVDVEAFWDWPVGSLPYPSMLHDRPSVAIDASIPFGGDVALFPVCRFRPSFTHDANSSGLHEHNMFCRVKPASLSSRLVFAQ